jgi:hypothetical protein
MRNVEASHEMMSDSYHSMHEIIICEITTPGRRSFEMSMSVGDDTTQQWPWVGWYLFRNRWAMDLGGGQNDNVAVCSYPRWSMVDHILSFLNTMNRLGLWWLLMMAWHETHTSCMFIYVTHARRRETSHMAENTVPSYRTPLLTHFAQCFFSDGASDTHQYKKILTSIYQNSYNFINFFK